MKENPTQILSNLYEEQKDVNGETNSIHLSTQNSEVIEKLDAHIEELKEDLLNLDMRQTEAVDMATAVRNIIQQVLTAYSVAKDEALKEIIEANQLQKEQLELVNQYYELNSQREELQESGEVDANSFFSRIENLLRKQGEDNEADIFSQAINTLSDESTKLVLGDVREYISSSVDDIIGRLQNEVVDLMQQDNEEEKVQQDLSQSQVMRHR